MTDRYYFYLLNKDCRLLYDRILVAINQRKTRVNCNDLKIDCSNVPEIYKAIELDNPSIFYVNFFNYKYLFHQGTNEVNSIQIGYLYSTADCSSLQTFVEESVQKIMARLSFENCTEFQKAWRLHDLIIGNVDYFHEALSKEKSFEWHRAHSILGLFLDKKAICSGISKAYKYLLNQIGVRSIVVDGMALDQNNMKVGHNWNIVKIDGENYHIDITWDITNSEKELKSYDYFNLKDEQIYRDHFTERRFPICSSVKDNYFDRNGFAIRNKLDWKRYFAESYTKLFGDYYVRIDYSCDLEEEAKRIEQHMISCRTNESPSWRKFINERQRIIRITIQNGK